MKNRIKLGLLLFAIFIAYCCYAAASKDLDLFVAGFAFMVVDSCYRLYRLIKQNFGNYDRQR